MSPCSSPQEYAILDGDVLSSAGRRINITQFSATYLEEHVRHSNALHNHTPEGKAYMVGPLARLNMNHARLHDKAAGALKASRVKLPLRNPFMAFFARAIELVEAYDACHSADPRLRSPGSEPGGIRAARRRRLLRDRSAARVALPSLFGR